MKRAQQAEIRPAGDRDGVAARGGPVWDGGRGSRSNTDRRGPLRKSCFEYDGQKTPLVTPAESLPFLTRDNPPSRPIVPDCLVKHLPAFKSDPAGRNPGPG